MLVAFNRYATKETHEVSFVIDSQSGRLIIHLVNLTSAGTWRQPTDEYIPIDPVKVRVKLSENVRGIRVQLLVADQKISGKVEKGWVHFTVNAIIDHEVIVVT